jgi:hypothetical protein
MPYHQMQAENGRVHNLNDSDSNIRRATPCSAGHCGGREKGRRCERGCRWQQGPLKQSHSDMEKVAEPHGAGCRALPPAARACGGCDTQSQGGAPCRSGGPGACCQRQATPASRQKTHGLAAPPLLCPPAPPVPVAPAFLAAAGGLIFRLSFSGGLHVGQYHLPLGCCPGGRPTHS